MAKVKTNQETLVFGLDIGTRSIVGTLGYLKADRFHVVAQCVKEHDTRSMLDGQIHDIMKVGETIRIVKETLENQLSVKLSEVCIAAAGRVLRTVTTTAEIDFEAEKEITNEDIYNLSVDGIEKAYAQFGAVNDTGLKFYCVGYTPMRYYMNGYVIGNLEGHKATRISADIIATFLPDDVVDGLYKAVEYAGLKVTNLTLEPIAAISVAIPEKFRMLNLALIDVGAGTSDISITSGGAIVAYGMIPTAGDSLTDIIVQNCLVDFETAENIKRKSGGSDTIEYEDILGLPQTIEPSAVLDMLDQQIENMSQLAADEIRRLNGDKSVSAVFVVGGGGTVKGYTDKVAEKLGIAKERVAIRGKEVLSQVSFDNENPITDSLMVTPIGIAMSYYSQSNNFIFVEFNKRRVKLYDNGRLNVTDVVMQVSMPNEDLFPKSGTALTFTVNGKQKMIRGHRGDSCIITINDEPADLHSGIVSGDVIKLVPSTKGEDASAVLSDIREMSEALNFVINGKNFTLPRTAFVNGKLQDAYYKIEDGDVIEINNFYTVKELSDILELDFTGKNVYINGTAANLQTKVYEGFTLEFKVEEKISFEEKAVNKEELNEDTVNEEADTDESDYAIESETDGADQNGDSDSVKISDSYENLPEDDIEDSVETVSETDSDKASESESAETVPVEKVIHDIHIKANGKDITMSGKTEYVFVDIFDYIDFDLRNPAGRSVVTLVNGQDAEYMKPLEEGDELEIYWS